MEYNFGEKVEKLLTQHGKTKKSLYDHLNMTANGFDAMIKNNSISAIRLASIADYFGVSVGYFYGLQSSTTTKQTEGAFGERVLEKMSQLSDELKRFFEEEIRTKNQQIAGLQRTVDALVGKSNGVPSEGRVVSLYPTIEKATA